MTEVKGIRAKARHLGHKRIPTAIFALAISVLATAALLTAMVATPAFALNLSKTANLTSLAGKHMYVIGDSWSAGLYADPNHTLIQDAATELNMTVTMDAESGTGYLNAPPDTATYVQRAAEIPTATTTDIVLIQGGSNDAGQDTSALKQAITQTIAEAHTRLPNARIVLLGPGPDPWPVTSQQTAVDTTLNQVATDQHVIYISPLAEQWFNDANINSIIDSDNNHPTVNGDVILGDLLAQDLQLRFDSTVIHPAYAHRHPSR